MIHKVRNNILGWASRLLFFFFCKIVLIRHVFSSMPLHLFHVLRPPATIDQHLEWIFSRFSWCDIYSHWRIYWYRWSSIYFPVAKSGVGVNFFSDPADAFELKVWWRFQNQYFLWAFLWSPSVIESSTQVWFSFAILLLPCRNNYALFVVLLNLISVGWLDLVIIISNII